MRGKRIGALIVALSVTASVAIFSQRIAEMRANALEPYWIGSDSSSIILREDDSPIEVEKGVLTLSIGDFPVPASGMKLSEYGARVKAEYTFYNPTERDVEMNLLFPFGHNTNYLDGEDDSALCSVTADGETVAHTMRHTFCTAAYNFEVNEELASVCNEKKCVGFLSDTTPVVKRTYRFTAADNADRLFAHLVFGFNPTRTRVLFDGSVKTSLEDGRVRATTLSAGSEGSMTAYFIGSSAENLSFSLSADALGAEPVEADSVQEDKSVTTLGALAESLRPQECAVSEVDWFNGYLDMLTAKSRHGAAYVSADWLSESSFMRWYEYTLTVPAGGRIVNTVTAPLYPSIEGEENPVYRYEYLLSPAQKWASFREIEIHIDTPYYLSDSSLTFEKREGGYSLSRNSLPIGELTFSLTETERVTTVFEPYDPTSAMTIALVSAGILTMGAAAAVIIFFVRRAKDRAKTVNAGVEEGTLPPERDDRK